MYIISPSIGSTRKFFNEKFILEGFSVFLVITKIPFGAILGPKFQKSAYRNNQNYKIFFFIMKNIVDTAKFVISKNVQTKILYFVHLHAPSLIPPSKTKPLSPPENCFFNKTFVNGMNMSENPKYKFLDIEADFKKINFWGCERGVGL